MVVASGTGLDRVESRIAKSLSRTQQEHTQDRKPGEDQLLASCSRCGPHLESVVRNLLHLHHEDVDFLQHQAPIQTNSAHTPLVM